MSRQGLAHSTVFLRPRITGGVKIPGAALIMGELPRRVQDQAACLGHQFLEQNRGLLQDFGIAGTFDFEGYQVELRLCTGGRVGALPPCCRPRVDAPIAG